MSVLITIGRFAGFSIISSSKATRVCLGWIAIIFFRYDLEESINGFMEQVRDRTEEGKSKFQERLDIALKEQAEARQKLTSKK